MPSRTFHLKRNLHVVSAILLFVLLSVGCSNPSVGDSSESVEEGSTETVEGTLTARLDENPSENLEKPSASQDAAAVELKDQQSLVLPCSPSWGEVQEMATVPSWSVDAIFYQIFPERFCNGDVNNDPIRESLDYPDAVSADWAVSAWTSDWYALSDWEDVTGGKFYDVVFHRRYGGDLQGVIEKLDYLQKLGVNALYFNPVFYAESLHKYDGKSMHHIDPYFGPDPQGDLEIMATETSDPDSWQWTSADRLFLELIAQAHRRGMRLIIDGVFNHTGRSFFAFADIVKNQQDSEYQDWYIVQSFDNLETPQDELNYKSWWGHKSLPEFSDNTTGEDLHPAPKEYLMNITERWMDPNGDGDPSDGIDGWRLDVANEVPMGFWQDWNARVREINPEAYTVGEFWDNARDSLIEGQFTATMNYHNFAFLVKGFLIDGKLTPHDFGRELQQRLQQYPGAMQFALQNLIDSHDTDRVASMIVNSGRKTYKQPERFDYDVSERNSARYWDEYSVQGPDDRGRRIQRLVALMQMTFVGPPMIYYGTEAGMWGGDDPCDRMPMVWSDLVFEDQASDPLERPRQAEAIRFRDELFGYYQRAIKLRNDSVVLRRGGFEPVTNDDDANFFVFRRKLDQQSLLIALNRGEAPFAWRLPNQSVDSLQQVFRTSDEPDELNIRQEGADCIVEFPALEGAVFAEIVE